MNFNILIAEDEEIVLDILASIVEMFLTKEYPFLDLTITKAINGKIALDIAKKVKQDIILSDIVMPEMGGIEFIKEVRQFDKSMPILVLSALSSQKDVEEIMNSGATNYTSKPLNEKIFTAQIKVFVDFCIHRKNRYNAKAVNLFSKNIYKRKTEFFIEKENDLLEFWEYIVRDSLDEYTSDTSLQYIYDVEYLVIKQTIFNIIVLEENDLHYYVTLSHLNELDTKTLQNIQLKYKLHPENHKNDGFHDSFIIPKTKYIEAQKEQKVIQNTEEERIKENLTDIENTKEFVVSDVEAELKSALLQDIRYSIHEEITPDLFLSELDPSYEDKIEDFLDDISLLNSSIYKFEESTEITKTRIYIQEIVSYIDKFDQFIDSLGLFNVISRAFSILMSFLNNLDDEIILNAEKRVLLSKMLLSIANDLESWSLSLFVDRDATDIHYFDASFSDNCLTVISIFNDSDDDFEDNLDDDDDDLEFF